MTFVASTGSGAARGIAQAGPGRRRRAPELGGASLPLDNRRGPGGWLPDPGVSVWMPVIKVKVLSNRRGILDIGNISPKEGNMKMKVQRFSILKDKWKTLGALKATSIYN